MTVHKKEMADLRVGCGVILRDWEGNTANAEAFLGRDAEWLARTESGAVFPILPRELIAVSNGRAAMYARLQEGAAIVLSDWEGGKVRGTARKMIAGWELLEKGGARWLIEPHRLVSVSP